MTTAQVEVVAKDGNVVARTDLADNQYSSADPRLVLFNQIAGEGRDAVRTELQRRLQRPPEPVDRSCSGRPCSRTPTDDRSTS